MKTLCKWLGQIAASAGLLGVMLAASGAALAADNYNITLKGLPTCATATGGFSFTKTVVTTTGSATPSPGTYFVQIVLTVPARSAPSVPGTCMNETNSTPSVRTVTRTFALPNPFNGVVVQNPFSLTGESQGLSVVGLAGPPMTNGLTGANNYTIQFSTSGIAGCPTSAGCSTYASPTRSFTLYNNGSSIFTGTYDARNVLATVPEPETLWLALAGLSALVLSRRRRRS